MAADHGARERARRARAALAQAIGLHRAVSMVDIGLAGQRGEKDPSLEASEIVLRVHLREEQCDLELPDEMDGFRVVVVPGNYQLED